MMPIGSSITLPTHDDLHVRGLTFVMTVKPFGIRPREVFASASTVSFPGLFARSMRAAGATSTPGIDAAVAIPLFPRTLGISDMVRRMPPTTAKNQTTHSGGTTLASHMRTDSPS